MENLFRRCWWPQIVQISLGIKVDTGGNIDRIRKPGILDEVRNRSILTQINRQTTDLSQIYGDSNQRGKK